MPLYVNRVPFPLFPLHLLLVFLVLLFCQICWFCYPFLLCILHFDCAFYIECYYLFSRGGLFLLVACQGCHRSGGRFAFSDTGFLCVEGSGLVVFCCFLVYCLVYCFFVCCCCLFVVLFGLLFGCFFPSQLRAIMSNNSWALSYASLLYLWGCLGCLSLCLGLRWSLLCVVFGLWPLLSRTCWTWL